MNQLEAKKTKKNTSRGHQARESKCKQVTVGFHSTSYTCESSAKKVKKIKNKINKK